MLTAPRRWHRAAVVVLLLIGFGTVTTACVEQPAGSRCIYSAFGDHPKLVGKSTCPEFLGWGHEIPTGSGCWYSPNPEGFANFFTEPGRGPCEELRLGVTIDMTDGPPTCWYHLIHTPPPTRLGPLIPEISGQGCPDHPPGLSAEDGDPDVAVQSTTTSTSLELVASTTSLVGPTPLSTTTTSTTPPSTSTSSSTTSSSTTSSSTTSSSTTSSTSSTSSSTTTTVVRSFTATATCASPALGVLLSGTGHPGAVISLTAVEPLPWRARTPSPAAIVAADGTWQVTIPADDRSWFPFNALVLSSNGEPRITVASPAC